MLDWDVLKGFDSFSGLGNDMEMHIEKNATRIQ